MLSFVRRLSILRTPLRSEAAASAQPTGASIPFKINRTQTKHLPVYVDYRNGGTKTVTIVRKFEGDVQALKSQLRALIGPSCYIEEKTGRIEVTGKHTQAIKKWMEGLGF